MPVSREKLIVYTCITNDYDRLVPPVFTSNEIRYICFTSRPEVAVTGWELRPIDPSLSGYPPGLINRRYKFFPWDFLPHHEWSIYVDGSIRILSDPRPLIGKERESGFLLLAPRHAERTSVDEELEACIYYGKLQGPAIDSARERVAYYTSDGFVDPNNLTENSILFRPGDPKGVRPAMEKWWDELKYFSGRDQISLPYVIWKFRLTLQVLDFSPRRRNKYFAAVEHRKDATVWVGFFDARRYHNRAWALAYHVVARTQNLIRRSRRALTRFARPRSSG